ncbi:CysS/YqeB C-terminal domain-containing protein [Actinoplanes couchii]|uniref:CysS/YqeB C-terminal domain-containing protein n=1 Tax=Actinoplanes couchii TaxID=403638 RepID=UPI001940A5D8|nr:hypothetical protein [Actinoplanes couchii]MDR6319617.1 hypothetical protein [Actinoplanes couchii]
MLTIMGSGETSPTMVSVHRAVAAGLPGRPAAVLIETPYAFQENVADISAKACQYFDRSVGLHVTVAPETDNDQALAMTRTADWLFCGPGSPTYALRRWTGSPVAQALHDRFRRRRGHTVFASAAAATLGRWTVPVYEIYKSGADPYWADGLDLLRHLDLTVAVVPHYDNREGGTHDTRFCYLGERRLRLLEQHLPDDAAVLGVDEHTAVHIDPGAGQVRVTGRGALTVRRHGADTVFPSGSALSLTELRALAHRGAAVRSTPPPVAGTPETPPTVSETAATCERRFDEALAARDADGMARAVLDLESAVHAWSTDTELDDGADQARAVLRTLILRLSRTATTGLTDPAALLAPLVQPLLDLRSGLRSRHDYATADALRTALSAAGITVQDDNGQVTWTLSR